MSLGSSVKRVPETGMRLLHVPPFGAAGQRSWWRNKAASNMHLMDNWLMIIAKQALVYRKSLSLNGLLEYMVDELFTDEEHN